MTGKPKQPASKRVVFLTGEFPPRHGGIGTYVAETARAAAEAGFEVTVGAPEAELAQAKGAPFTLWPLPVDSGQGWWNRRRLAAHLTRHQDLLSQSTVVLAEPLPLRAFAEKPSLPAGRLVIVFHGSELRRLTQLAASRARLQRLLRPETTVGVVSGYVEDLLREAFLDLTCRVVRVPGSIASALRPRVIPSRQSGVASAERPLRILCVGRVHARKGQDLLLAAMAQLDRARFRLQLVGPSRHPEFRRQLESLIRIEGLTNVEWVGPVDDGGLQDAYARADVLVFPSRESGQSVEGLGLTLLEAQAWGLPVVAAETGGTGEAFASGVTGLAFDSAAPDAAKQLADRLRQLADAPELRRRLGEAGPAWVEARFSWAANVRALLEGPTE